MKSQGGMLASRAAARAQVGSNGNKAVVLCSTNGTVTASSDVSLQACGTGYACAPLSPAEIQANSRFDPAMASMAGVRAFAQPMLEAIHAPARPSWARAWQHLPACTAAG